jgi:type I restriction enzyme R subunit
MVSRSLPPTNFGHLEEYDQQLVRLGMLAERYFTDDPNTSIVKLRQLAEVLAQDVASRVGSFTSAEESQFDLVRRLQDEGIFPRKIAQLLSEIRSTVNAATHSIRTDHGTALSSFLLSSLAFVFTGH